MERTLSPDGRARWEGASILLGDVPPHRHRAGEPARDAVLAVGAEGLVLAQHDISALGHHAVGDRKCDLLALVGIALAGECRAQLFHLWVAWPAEPRLVAAAAGEELTAGLSASTVTVVVKKMFQPPLSGASFLA